MGEQICIYCRESDKSFAQEHVMPQSFGTFNQNFTLNNEVCKECNQFFGDNLEPYLGRGSGEGLARWRHGIKSPEEFKNLWQSRFKTTVRNPGDWKGASPDYSRFLHFFADTKSLLCYKHAVNTMFEVS